MSSIVNNFNELGPVNFLKCKICQHKLKKNQYFSDKLPKKKLNHNPQNRKILYLKRILIHNHTNNSNNYNPNKFNKNKYFNINYHLVAIMDSTN